MNTPSINSNVNIAQDLKQVREVYQQRLQEVNDLKKASRTDEVQTFTPINVAPVKSIQSTQATSNSSGIEKAYEGMIKAVDGARTQYDNSLQDNLLGRSNNINQVMLDRKKSELAFKFFVETNNLLIEGYNQMKSLQV